MHNISVVCLTRLARSPGGLGGRSRIEFIVSPLPRRRHNESHFAAEPPERSFFFPLFLSAEKEKEVIGGAVGKSLSVKQNVTFAGTNALARYTSSPPAGGASPQGEAKVGVVPRGSPRKQVLPRIQKLSPLCTTSLSVTAPGLPVLRGVSGGRSRIEPRFFASSLFAGANRGSLRGAVP